MNNVDYLRRKADERASDTDEGKQHTEKYIRGQISYHESGADFYLAQDQITLAAWSRAMAAEWRKRLKAFESQFITGEGSIQ